MECEAVRAEQAPGSAITSWASHVWSAGEAGQDRKPQKRKNRAQGARHRDNPQRVIALARVQRFWGDVGECSGKSS